MNLFEMESGAILNLDHVLLVSRNELDPKKYDFYLSYKVAVDTSYVVGTQKDFDEIKKLCRYPEKKLPLDPNNVFGLR